MSVTYPASLTDGTGRTWEWSELWGGYRSEGMVTHGYDTIRTQWGIGEEPRLMWKHEAETTHDCLRARGVVNPETGEAFTVTEIDWAIQGAMEHERGIEGWSGMPDINELIWWSITQGVCDRLGIGYDEMCEVAP